MTPTDPRLTLIAQEAKVRTCCCNGGGIVLYCRPDREFAALDVRLRG